MLYTRSRRELAVREKTLDYDTDLPYTVAITPGEDGVGFNAEIPRPKGCMAFGESIGEAY